MAKACQGRLSAFKSGKNRWKGQPPKSEKGKKGYYKLPPKSEKEERKERTLQPSSKSGQGLVGEADSRHKTFHLQVCDFLDHHKLIFKVCVNVGIVFYLKIEYKSVKYKDEGSKGSKKAMLHVFLLKSYSELGPGVEVQSKDECIFWLFRVTLWVSGPRKWLTSRFRQILPWKVLSGKCRFNRFLVSNIFL